MNLVIVESPAKAKTIGKYLGSSYIVKASLGHVRQLPSKTGSVLPDKNFQMEFETNPTSKKYISEIAKYSKNSSTILLATDPDREGEAISWHVVEILKNKKALKKNTLVKRVVFNEITKNAVTNAINSPREIDYNLVEAQKTRQALDYLVGFTLSPLLWRKLPGCRSAGRVQSVALRLICEREKEIEIFVPKEYWDITLEMQKHTKENFQAKLYSVDDEKLTKFSIENKDQAEILKKRLTNSDYIVSNIESKTQKRNPYPPFITSTLQQEAARKLGFRAKRTMQIAQKLYEGINIGGETVGLITYMRTDGVSLSNEAINTIRDYISSNFGNKYLPNSPNIYKSKSKNAQEAHEAIRPTNIKITPESIKNELDNEQYKLYDLIWKRAVACQMSQAKIDTISVEINAEKDKLILRAVGSNLSFDGFYKIYKEQDEDTKDERYKTLPNLTIGEKVVVNDIIPKQHFTDPPPRFTEASLVKKLEELGIGRPSTYATIISVIQERNYVHIENKRFFPDERGRILTAFLVNYFLKYVEYDFTRGLEEDLDKIAEGNMKWLDLLKNFWNDFNNNIQGLTDYNIKDIIDKIENMLDYHLFPKSDDNPNPKKCNKCDDGTINLRLGKFGAFLACSNYPECKNTKKISTITNDNSEVNEDIETKSIGKVYENEVFLKKGPYGFYLEVQDPESRTKNKVKRCSIPNFISPHDVDLNIAKDLLSLPKIIGLHPETNLELKVGIGRFGPFILHDKKFTSIPKSHDVFNLQLDEAIDIIKNSENKKINKPKSSFKKRSNNKK